MIDLGTHEETGPFGTKHQRKVRLSFELPEEKAVFNEEKGEQPFMVSKEYTFSMGEKANLRKVLTTWRGEPFTEQQAADFDIDKLLGKPCLLNVVHKTSKTTGNVYVDVAGISKVPKGTAVPPQINPSVIFSLDNPDMEAFERFPDWLKEKIASSPEFKFKMAPPTSEVPPSDTEEDEIPF